MKKCLFKVTMFAALTAAFVACKDDSKDEVEDFRNENTLGLPESVSSDDNAVDLGLTSGTKWAKMNIGAKNPWDYGDYFAWGETTAKTIYDWSTYLHVNKGQAEEGQEWEHINKYQIADGSNGIWYNNIKYVGDNKTTLDPEDDAAHVNWGGDWEMPSPEDFIELRSNCVFDNKSKEYTEYNGVGGVMLKSNNNGATIFFPNAGFAMYNFVNAGSSGIFWANSIGRTDAANKVWTMSREASDPYFVYDPWGRTAGVSVRAVCKAGGNTNGHDAVDLGLPSGKLWATMNIGAEKIEDYGYYLAWGETEPKEIYTDSTYKHIVKTDLGWSISKYQMEDNDISGVWYTKDFCGDGKTVLEDVDDAAVANWGGKWKMPTDEQFRELMGGCYWLYTENYADTTNIAGYIIYKAKADADKHKIIDRISITVDNVKPLDGYTLADTHIFMPFAGRYDERTVGYYGYYWSSTLVGSTVGAFSAELPWTGSNQRCQGLSIRPVCK